MITQSFQNDNLLDIAKKVQRFQLENVKACQYHNIHKVSNLISNNDNLFFVSLKYSVKRITASTLDSA